MMSNKKDSSHLRLNTRLYCVSSQQDRATTKFSSASIFRNMFIAIIPPCGEEHILTSSLDNQFNLAKTKFNGCSQIWNAIQVHFMLKVKLSRTLLLTEGSKLTNLYQIAGAPKSLRHTYSV